MDRPALMAIVVAFLVVLLVLMYLGWRARRKRQRDVATPAAVPVDRGAAIGEFAGKYVATTEAGKPLERIAVHGLGFRGTVSLAVTQKGIAARIAGGDEFWIPASDLRGLSRATWTIDRVVEPDGLQVVAWTLGDRIVDTYLRFDEPQAFETAVGRLTAERNIP